MKIIDNNPYRLLGVFSTSSQKEIVANQGKMKAFLKVGKEVNFPLDLSGILPALKRTEQNVAEAHSKLTLPADQLKYAQFWFAKSTPLDEIACGRLVAGDMDGAISIWNKKESASSLQNLIVCSLIRGELNEVIAKAENLYTNHDEEFLKIVLGENALVSSDNLAHNFLDILCEDFKPRDFLDFITNSEWSEYVGSKTTGPLIDEINSVIIAVKNSKKETNVQRYNAGVHLINSTKADFAELKKYLPSTDLRYQMIADKLGLAILQCAIDYYNNSEQNDAAFKAMKIQKYALSMVVGDMAKARCKENVDILQKIINELPPEGVFDEDKAIKDELIKFCKLPDKICHSVTLLNNTKPYLQKIKNKLGSANKYYLKVSTQVVGNALHNLIEEVNLAQNAVAKVMKETYDESFKAAQAYACREVLKTTFEAAWNAIKIMDSFDMETDFKTNRYNQQRSSLKDICEKLGVSTSPSFAKPAAPSRSTGSSSTGGSGSSGSGNDDLPWGCIIPAIIGFIIFLCSLG